MMCRNTKMITVLHTDPTRTCTLCFFNSDLHSEGSNDQPETTITIHNSR
jgi:hypothetical protein